MILFTIVSIPFQSSSYLHRKFATSLAFEQLKKKSYTTIFLLFMMTQRSEIWITIYLMDVKQWLFKGMVGLFCHITPS